MVGRVALATLPIDDVMPQLVAAVRDRDVRAGRAARRRQDDARAGCAARCGRDRRSRSSCCSRDGWRRGWRRRGSRASAASSSAARSATRCASIARSSAATRIELVTEGVLTRRLLGDPELRGVGCVVIDEFHERHLDGDLALALVARLREQRPELALLVMSATLDAEPVAAFLGDAPIVRSEGRTFPLTIEYLAQPDDRHLGKQVAAAVRRLAQQKLDGDVLVFLPGTGEIRRCAEDLEDAARTFDLAVLPLHGDLTADEQDAAVRPATRRKVILATNVAETSVTIDGVTAVIDSGLARIARFSPWSGIPSLEIEPVSRASCAQRAGRAGRTRPGSRAAALHEARSRHAARVRGAGDRARGSRGRGARAVRRRPRGARRVALVRSATGGAPCAPPKTCLARLGASADWQRSRSSAGGCCGFRCIRASGACCASAKRAASRARACVIAGLLGARELRLARRGPGATAQLSSPSDLIDDLDAFLDARAGGLRPDRLRRDSLDVAPRSPSIAPRSSSSGIVDMSRARRRATTPTSIASSRSRSSPRIPIASASAARRARTRSCSPAAAAARSRRAPSVIEPELLVAVDVAETGARGQAARACRSAARAASRRAGCSISTSIAIAERDELVWNAERQRVERVAQMTYDGLAIDEQRDVEGARRAGRAAAAAAREAGARRRHRALRRQGRARRSGARGSRSSRRSRPRPASSRRPTTRSPT